VMYSYVDRALYRGRSRKTSRAACPTSMSESSSSYPGRDPASAWRRLTPKNLAHLLQILLGFVEQTIQTDRRIVMRGHRRTAQT